MVNFFGHEFFHISKGDKLQDVMKKIGLIRGLRPEAGASSVPYNSGYYISKYASSGLKEEDLFDIAKSSGELVTILRALRGEMFRNGYKIKPKFMSKCPECGKEYQTKVTDCDECGGTQKMIVPDNKLVRDTELFLKRVNDNGQSLIELSEIVEDDANIIDRLFILFINDYEFNDLSGEIVSRKVREIIRVDPLAIRPLRDKSGNPGSIDDGQKVYFCLQHRNVLQRNEGKCHCGLSLKRAFYETQHGTSKQYYSEDEVVYENKYKKGFGDGWSPIASVWEKLLTLMAMDSYMREYYQNMGQPKGLLLFNSRNRDSIQNALNEAREQVRINPHSIPTIAIPDSGSTRGDTAQFINFMNNLNEMQYTEARNEFRKCIGAVFGVMPIFQADISVSGGLNNEGLQVTVTNRAIESGQRLYNDKVYPKILSALGLSDDWELVLEPSEERDEMAELQQKSLEIANAQAMLGLGYGVELDNEGEFHYSGRFATKPQSSFNPTSNSLFNEKPEAGLTNSFQGSPEPKEKSLSVFKVRYPIIGGSKEIVKEIMDKLQEVARFVRKRRSVFEAKAGLLKYSTELSGILKRGINDAIIKTYQESFNDTSREIGEGISLGTSDVEAINALTGNGILSKAYGSFSTDVSQQINELIGKSYQEAWDIDTLVGEMSNIIEEKKSDLYRIARTETQHVSNIARENSFMKVKDYDKILFKWINPNDYRTTDICKEIMERTKDGVTLEELKKIVNEVSIKHNGAGWTPRDFTGHINCRSTFSRYFG